MRMHRIVAAAAASVLLAGSLTAQERIITVRGYGGGFSHLVNLSEAGPDAHFGTGYSLGGSVGTLFSPYFGVQADFTYARNEALGAIDIATHDVQHFFYGAEAVGRYPFGNGLTPYALAGVGAVTIDQVWGEDTFTKPAGVMGLGLELAIPGSNFQVFAEGKGLLFNWDRNGFDRTQFDVAWTGGLGYRFAW